MGYEIMKTTIIFATTMLMSASVAFAQSKVPVPEIDALSGIAALAVVGAAVALIRERSKR